MLQCWFKTKKNQENGQIDFLVMWDYRFPYIVKGLLRQLINLEIMSESTLFNQCITFSTPGWHDSSLVSLLLCTQMTRVQILAFPIYKSWFVIFRILMQSVCSIKYDYGIVQKLQLCSMA